jgi:Glycosyl transferases group 1
MLGSWPEPFGLVAIESLATGTPVIARRAGALPELIEPGVDGFLVDDLIEAELAVRRVASLDRTRIRQRALERFSTDRMTRDYEAVYARVLDGDRRVHAMEPDTGPTRSAAFQGLPARLASGAAEPTGVLVEGARGSGRAWRRRRA